MSKTNKPAPHAPGAPSTQSEDELRDEYDFSQLTGRARGKYFERYQQGTNLVRLAPDVAAAFPTEQAVNDALRKLIEQNPSPQNAR